MYDKPKILLCGDRAITVEFGNEISEECNRKVIALDKKLKRLNHPGIISIVSTYRSLLVKYDPLRIGIRELTELLEKVMSDLNTNQSPELKPLIYEIPVAYGGEFGPDLDFVAQYNNLTPDEVIRIHTEPLYRIYMIGFIMGFAYLGGMSEKIATPRLEKPRTEIKAGSVGIADKQTGIYPISSPGGWRIIGRTPVKLYDPLREKPILFEAGNYIKFVNITKEEFEQIQHAIEKRKYEVKITYMT